MPEVVLVAGSEKLKFELFLLGRSDHRSKAVDVALFIWQNGWFSMFNFALHLIVVSITR